MSNRGNIWIRRGRYFRHKIWRKSKKLGAYLWMKTKESYGYVSRKASDSCSYVLSKFRSKKKPWKKIVLWTTLITGTIISLVGYWIVRKVIQFFNWAYNLKNVVNLDGVNLGWMKTISDYIGENWLQISVISGIVLLIIYLIVKKKKDISSNPPRAHSDILKPGFSAEQWLKEYDRKNYGTGLSKVMKYCLWIIFLIVAFYPLVVMAAVYIVSLYLKAVEYR